MKFREHDRLTPIVITAKSPEELEQSLEGHSYRYDFIDLQYSTTTLADGSVQYSALVLAQRHDTSN